MDMLTIHKCVFCGCEITLAMDEWGIQTPHGSLPEPMCGKCEPDAISPEHKKQGYRSYVSRQAIE